MNSPSGLDIGPRGRVRAVVFDLMFTLIQPEYLRFPGGRGRMGWIAGLLGLEEADLVRRWRQFEPVLEAGEAPSAQFAHGVPERPELTWVRAVAQECGVPLEDDVRAAIEADWDLPYRQALRNPSGEGLATLAALRERGLRLGLLSDTHGLEVRAWPRSPLSPAASSTPRASRMRSES